MRQNAIYRKLAWALLLAVLLSSLTVPGMAAEKTFKMLMSKVTATSSEIIALKATQKVNGNIVLRVGEGVTLQAENTKDYYGQSSAWAGAAKLKVIPLDNCRTSVKGIHPGAQSVKWTDQNTGATCSIRFIVLADGEPEPTSIAIAQGKSATLAIGETLELEAVASPAGANGYCTWASSKPAVADVFAGDVTAVAEGTAKITATAYNGKKATITVKVVDGNKPTAVSITNGKSITITEGDIVKLEAALTPATAASKLTWKSSKKNVVRVSADGTIEGWRKGTAKVTVTTANKKKATITVKVKKDVEGSITRVAHPVFNESLWSDHPTPDQVYKAIMAMKKQYPNGKHWTNSDFYEWNASYQGYGGGAGCSAFACILSDAAFGHLPYRVYDDVSEIRVGDVLRVHEPKYEHSVTVIKVDSKKVTVAEGNWQDKIKWGRTITKAHLKKVMAYAYTRYVD